MALSNPGCLAAPGCSWRRRPCTIGPRNRAVAAAAGLSDRELQIKMSVASNTDKLDLSDCRLTQLPPALLELRSLRELSLAGNQLTELPPEISQLKDLEKLVVAGNQLQQLPEEIGELQHLDGLWAHGNTLHQLPDSLSRLTKLKALSLAGNCLQQIPAATLRSLSGLTDLNLSGNQLTALPDPIGSFPSLIKLALHGNQLQQLPEQGWSDMVSLKELGAQGNQLQSLPQQLGQLPAVVELSVADNQLTRLHDDWTGCSSLQKLHLYGNQLQQLPLTPPGLPALFPAAEGASGGGPLRSCWLEGNPFSAACMQQLLQAASSAGPFRLGLDQQQLAAAGAGPESLAGTSVRAGKIKGQGPGYFKLQRCSSPAAAAAQAAGVPCVLVVAFGSAPGLPNWGGVLSRVTAAAEQEAHRAFDVLFVVDPHRSWYRGGDRAQLQAMYLDRLQQYTQDYDKVVMMGDSMGATAALLFSPLATSVLSFCPQVDLTTASIRPGQPLAWQQQLTEQLQSAVGSSSAHIQVLTGTWQHDMGQATLLQHHQHVQVKVFSVDSHRLALVLAARGELHKMLGKAILQEMGLSSPKAVKLVNYL